MTRASERISALALSSQTDLTARQTNVEANRIHREVMIAHVRMFGLAIAMRLLFRTKLPKVDTRIIIRKPHKMWALDASQCPNERMFFPGTFTGTCSACGEMCTSVGAPITLWGNGWARFECWAEEISWLDSYEIKRRDVLTALYREDYIKNVRYYIGHRVTDWDDFEKWIMRVDKPDTPELTANAKMEAEMAQELQDDIVIGNPLYKIGPGKRIGDINHEIGRVWMGDAWIAPPTIYNTECNNALAAFASDVCTVRQEIESSMALCKARWIRHADYYPEVRDRPLPRLGETVVIGKAKFIYRRTHWWLYDIRTGL